MRKLYLIIGLVLILTMAVFLVGADYSWHQPGKATLGTADKPWLGIFQGGSATVMTMEGATYDDYETTLATIDPTTDATVSLPNETGTGALLGTKMTSATGTGITVSDSAAIRTQLYKVTVDYTQFDSAGVTHDLTIGTLPAKAVVHTAIADVTEAFVCAAVCTTATLSSTLGVSAGGVELLVSFDIDAATATFGDADAEVGDNLDVAADTNGGYPIWAGSALVIQATSGTGNWGDGAGTTNLNAGSITFYILYSVFP